MMVVTMVNTCFLANYAHSSGPDQGCCRTLLLHWHM